MTKYGYPLDKSSASLHTPQGVLQLIEKSQLMDLLRELERDGHDVSGAAAELTALVNYVTSTNISTQDVLTHLDYCAMQLRKNL
ncbi:hypothetical protein ACI09J_001759 [Cronobacter turicensis]